jgi:hypothetical protein
MDKLKTKFLRDLINSGVEIFVRLKKKVLKFVRAQFQI